VIVVGKVYLSVFLNTISNKLLSLMLNILDGWMLGILGSGCSSGGICL